MSIASLVSLGVPVDVIQKAISHIPAKIFVEEVKKGVVSGIRVHFEYKKGRLNTEQMFEIINKSTLLRYKTNALDTLETIASFESQIHKGKVHLDELSEIDTVIDIISFFSAIEYISPDIILCDSIPLGNGVIESEHGILPVPSPLTMRILESAGAKVKPGGIGECVTPTGAALMKCAKARWEEQSFFLEKEGIGFGTRNEPELNILRVILGYTNNQEEKIFCIEANIDDMSPEFFPHITEKLIKEGAQDVWIETVIGRKGRPSFVLKVLSKEMKITKTIFENTTTIGLRFSTLSRITLERDIREFDTRFGKVRAKISKLNGEIVNVKPEFEDIKTISEKENVPIKKVYSDVCYEVYEQKVSEKSK